MKKANPTSPPLTLPILLAFAAVYLIWGSTYLAIRIGIETVPPFLLAGVRFVLAGSLLYTWLRVRGTSRPTFAMWRGGALIGGLMMFGGNGVVTWAQQMVPSAMAALLVATVPLWMVVLDTALYHGPRPCRHTVVGLLLGTLGVGLLVGPSDGAVQPFGALLLIIASLSWANGSLLNRSVTLPPSPWMAAALQMLAGGALLLVAGTVTGEWSRLDLAAVSTRSLMAMLYLAFFGSIVAHTAYVYLLRSTSAAAVSTYAFVNPVIALLLGWATGEAIGGRALLGAAAIVGAVVLIHWAKVRPRRRAPLAPLAGTQPATATGDGR